MQVEYPMPSESFLLELDDMSRVDWPSVWAGPPQGGSGEFQDWCARYDWDPQTVENDLRVITRNGNEVTLSANGQWSPVISFKFYRSLADIETSEIKEKREVVKRGIAEWKRLRDSISQKLGNPTWSGEAGDSDFPESPVDGYWRKPRSSKGNPFRLAYWSPPQDSHIPVVVLNLGVTRDTWEPDGGSGSILSASFRPPLSRDKRG